MHINEIRKLITDRKDDSAFTKEMNELDILQKHDDYDEPEWIAQAEIDVGIKSSKDTAHTGPIVYKGCDIKCGRGGGQCVLNRTEYTLSEAKKFAKKNGYNVIISCEKNDGEGKYYLKGKNSTYEQSKEKLDGSPVTGARGGYKQKIAYLLE